jgi:HPt (histidine-containing phosphotransfer) domain-containing protein
MDAFLSKPVGVDQIETLLLQRFGMRGIVPTQSSVITEPTLVSPTSKPAVLAASKSARKRFRSGDAALHLDMAMLGEVCVAVSLSGYRALLDSFLSDESHSFYKLATALDNCDVHALQESAHAFKGAAASIGLHALATLAAHIEHSGHGYVPDECAENAQKLHTLFDAAHGLCHRMGLTGLAAKEC